MGLSHCSMFPQTGGGGWGSSPTAAYFLEWGSYCSILPRGRGGGGVPLLLWRTGKSKSVPENDFFLLGKGGKKTKIGLDRVSQKIDFGFGKKQFF